MKVLVVDDSAVMRRIVSKALTDGGHTDLVEASDGREALAKVDEVDFILIDWNMPVMDGLTFVREVRKKKNTPIGMITTENAQKEARDALKSSVNDYIVKPFTAQGLLTKFESVVNRTTV